ncbi:hypothetical protein FQN55_004155 [Onygenales sp. PD_40]|nr:hypothetical protein FQN55_004155 [Onygenales sp. PD_40]KAK2792594.1 hypothetical protein FQN52_003099 [Onygenales sp. PD_12]KAK2801528.1 hypothetical protein FQN51_005235 [Onygenales sp. PD_10]
MLTLRGTSIRLPANVNNAAVTPYNRQHRINANSFQQNAILSYNGWQYAAFYMPKHEANEDTIDGSPRTALVVNISRRRQSSETWETLMLKDYEQTADDGHNTISIGICEGDGTVHVSFDMHCDPLRFRISKPGLANDPERHAWSDELFGPVLGQLPGVGDDIAQSQNFFSELTYPRFLSAGEPFPPQSRAGSGSEILFKYSSTSHLYSYVGYLLKGVGNSPYINGLSYADGRVHVSGTYRHFVDYEGVNDPSSTKHKANAGPNGPENNYGLFYAYCDYESGGEDGSFTFRNTNGDVMAVLGRGESIYPDAEGLVVFDIPMNSGILNQEGQTVDGEGGFHVLNRERIVGPGNGEERWMHYYRSKTGQWSKYVLPGPPYPTETGARGSVISVGSNVFFALPGNTDGVLAIVRGGLSGPRGEYQIEWSASGFSGEPHLDTYTQSSRQMLSVFTTTAVQKGEGKVVVLDFVVG